MKIGKPTKEYEKIVKDVPTLVTAATAADKAKHKYLTEEIKMYVEIPHSANAEALHKDGYHDWVRIEKDTISGIFSKDDHRFEAFVQGYISYFETHDSVIGNDDRIIYFDWNPDSNHDLIIYMKPLYARNFPDYDAPMSHFPFSNPPTVIDPPPISKVPPPGGR